MSTQDMCQVPVMLHMELLQYCSSRSLDVTSMSWYELTTKKSTGSDSVDIVNVLIISVISMTSAHQNKK